MSGQSVERIGLLGCNHITVLRRIGENHNTLSAKSWSETSLRIDGYRQLRHTAKS